jgi:hypothetical protein
MLIGVGSHSQNASSQEEDAQAHIYIQQLGNLGDIGLKKTSIEKIFKRV